MLNNAIHKSKVPFGASFKLTLTGPAQALAQEVNTLFNCGAVRNIPDTYEEGTDLSVTLDSPQNRFYRGMISLAETSMVLDGTHRKTRKNKRGWYARAIVRAAHFARQFQRGKESWQTAVGETVVIGDGRTGVRGGNE